MSRNTRLVILAAYSHLVETVAIVDRIVIKGVVVYLAYALAEELHHGFIRYS